VRDEGLQPALCRWARGGEGHLAVGSAGGQARGAGTERGRQVDSAAKSWPATSAVSPARPGRLRGRGSAICSRSRRSMRQRTLFGNVIEGLAETKALLDRFKAVSARFAEDL